MNSKGHLAFSIIKSALRMIGCLFVLLGSNNFSPSLSLGVLAGFLFSAEVLGVFEELVDMR